MAADEDMVAAQPEARNVRRKSQPVLALAALASGAALLATILTRVSLGLTLAAFAVLMAVVFTMRLSRLAPAGRLLVRHRAAVGLVAGLSATLAYDLVRLAVAAVFRFQFNPFGTWPIFGQLIIGGDMGAAQWIVGATYHYLNGLMFAVGYCLLLPGRNWKYGVLWALGLETFTVAFYPGWLHLHDIVLQEFTVVSMAGHLAYGSTLGVVAGRLLRGPTPADRVA